MFVLSLINVLLVAVTYFVSLLYSIGVEARLLSSDLIRFPLVFVGFCSDKSLIMMQLNLCFNRTELLWENDGETGYNV